MAREKICGIYKITNPKKKVYIGQSVNINSRFSFYKRLDCKKQPKIYNSLKKYGIEKHKFEIIHICTREELNDLEKYYVDLYQTFNSKFGLNVRDGGGSKGKLSEETLKNMGSWNIGRKATEETLKKMSISKLGDKNPFFGKNHEEKCITVLRNRNTGIKYSKETNDKKVRKGSQNGISKLVLNTLTGIFYECVREAAETINMPHKSLANKLRGAKKNYTPFIYV